jgi:magnesium-transporting ATPase (P-type)
MAIAMKTIPRATTTGPVPPPNPNHHHHCTHGMFLRHDVETKLTLLGLLLFENPLKAEAANVIATLHAASIDIRMITGDNVLTAIHSNEIDR